MRCSSFSASSHLWSAYTQDVAKAGGREQFYLTAAKNQRLWDLNKDTSQQEFVVNLAGFLDYYYPTVMDWFEWVDAAIMETVPNPSPTATTSCKGFRSTKTSSLE